ncbi:MAG TPA: Hsp70 family protein [Catenuloplanes sp.]
MTEPVLVVDLGTSATAATLIIDGHGTPLREPQTGSVLWPSSVCLDGDTFLVGTAAERRKRSIPRRYIDGPRRAIDAGAAMWLDQREVTGAEALTAYLAALAGEARRSHGGPVTRLLLVVPAGYPVPDARRDVLIGVGGAAGFTDVELINDVVAAALDPQTGAGLTDGDLVLVCDLGATWTAALVRVHGQHPAQLAQETGTAGRDLDALLINDLRAEGRAWLEPLLASPGDAGLRAYYEAIDFTRRLKHQLSDAEEVEDHLTPITPPYRLTREWLQAFADPGVRDLVASCHHVLTAAGATPADLAAVVLAGGAARLSMVVPALREGLGPPGRRSAEPQLAVVRGAAHWAAGAPDRTVPADPPGWRVEPVTWEIPGGQARLLRWVVGAGEGYEEGSVLAEVRVGDERIFALTAPLAGTVLEHRASVGDLVGPTLVIAAARDRAAMAEDPPTPRRRLVAPGSWLLTADRQVLVECDAVGRYVRSHAVGDGGPLGEFRPDLGTGTPLGARIFVDPDGRPALVAWDDDGGFAVWDVETGKLTARFRDPSGASAVRVNEAEWRLAAEAEGKVPVGRYRRSAVTLWDLRTGARVEKITDEGWQRRHPGYADRSGADGFRPEALSPDGALRSRITDHELLLSDVGSGQELFRASGPPDARGGTAFSADGRQLLVTWELPPGRERAERSQVHVWDI